MECVHDIGGEKFCVADCSEIDGFGVEANLVGDAATEVSDCRAETAIGGDTVGLFKNEVQFAM